MDTSLTKADLLSGTVVSILGNLPDISNSLKIKYNLFNDLVGNEDKKNITPIIPNEMLMLSVNTSITVGIVTKVTKDIIEMKLKIPVVPIKGESIGISRNINGHWRLIGFGEIE